MIQLTEIKLLAKPLGIKKIEMNYKGGSIEFEKNPNINPMSIVKLIQAQPDVYQLKGQEKLTFNLKSTEESQINTLKFKLFICIFYLLFYLLFFYRDFGVNGN